MRLFRLVDRFCVCELVVFLRQDQVEDDGKQRRDDDGGFAEDDRDGFRELTERRRCLGDADAQRGGQADDCRIPGLMPSEAMSFMPVMAMVEKTVTVAPPRTHWGIVVRIAENFGTTPASSKSRRPGQRLSG